MKHTTPQSSPGMEVIGWAGTVLILVGYAMFSTGIIPDVMVYHILNLIGSIGVAALSYHRRIWQTAIINTAFAFFAAVALLRTLL